jgi:hypothetical protein
LSTYEKEYLAILLAVNQWRSYLQHAEFYIFTDQRSLSHLNEQRLHTPWQQKVFTKLLGLQYKVIYKKGTDNNAADALSRRPHGADLYALSATSSTWLQAVIDGYQQDAEALRLLTELAVAEVPPYSLHNGVIRYNNRVWLGSNVQVQTKVTTALHSSAIGGHSGFPVTYSRIKQLFYWPGMKAFIKKFVAACEVCHKAKPDRSRYPGLLQPLPVPQQAWQSISLDFIEGLPRSNTYDTVLVVVDRLTKYGHFIPLHHPFTALKVAQRFMDTVYRLHGMPESIVSDRDRVFTSTLWKELFRLSDTQLLMSSSYHPQTDGQTERVNQCLETFLRCFVQSCPTKWSLWLSVAEYWYNCCFHTSLGRSPFEVLYGRSPRHFGLTVADSVSHADLNLWLSQRDLMLRMVQHHLLRAQQRMKHQADKNRSERVFNVGDMVYLRLQPYVQTSVATRANHKLSYKYFGPFQILQKVGTVAYKLQLPDSATVHPVFHVSQLKSSPRPNCLVSSTLPDTAIQYPLQVLQHRTISRGGRQIDQVLIRWSHSDAALDTWEDEEALQQRFPKAAAWGQAASQERGYVRKPRSQEQKRHVQVNVEREKEEVVQDNDSLMGRGRRVRRPSGRFPSDVWTN